MRRIILDTNFLLIPYQFKVDIFSEIKRICSFKYELCIIDKTIDELKKIAELQKGKDKLAAVLAMSFIGQKGVSKISTEEGLVDDLIVDVAQKGDIVATQDAELKQKLKKKGISLIVLRDKAHLGLLEG